jgi:hypothetical protein
MLNRENPGALYQNRQSRTVDLGSNSHGRARARWTALCTRRTGPRWTAPLNAKGYAIRAVQTRSKGPGRVRAGCSGARQGLAGVAPGRRSRPSFRARIGSTRSSEVRAHA